MPPLNYLQGMAGRFGRGANTLGSMEDPRARFAQQLQMESMDTSPAFVGEGISRLGKALVGALLAKRSMEDRADASRWLTAKMPDRTRQPTEAEAFAADPELELLRQHTLRPRTPGVSQLDDVLRPDTDDVLMGTGRIPKTLQELSVLNYLQEQHKDFPEQTEFTHPFTGAKETATAEDWVKLPKRIEEGERKFAEQMEDARQASMKYRPRDYAQELASGMEAYRSNPLHQISDPYTRMEWLRESAQGREANPFISRMLENLMFAEIARDDEEALYQRGRTDTLADAATKRKQEIEDRKFGKRQTRPRRSATPGMVYDETWNPETGTWDRGPDYDPKILSKEALEQKKSIKAPTRPKTVTMAEGVFILNDDGSVGPRLGSPAPQFGYPDSPGQPVGQQQPVGQPLGQLGQPQAPQQTGGIPIHPVKPWSRLPIRNQGVMQQEVHKTSRAMLEKNRKSLEKQDTMRDGLKRFQYLNAQQTQQAEESPLDPTETKTGSMADRVTQFSFDPEKIEMSSITKLLTPQMRQGLPGAASDRDVAMFMGATVGIDKPQEINDNIIKGALARLDNAGDRQSFMEEYFQVNQHLDGAEIYWKRYLEANPIFDHSPELAGSYTLNANRKSYKEFFRTGEAHNKPRSGRAGDTAGRGNADMVYDPVTKKLIPNRRQ